MLMLNLRIIWNDKKELKKSIEKISEIMEMDSFIDNKIENLRVVSKEENIRHSCAHPIIVKFVGKEKCAKKKKRLNFLFSI